MHRELGGDVFGAAAAECGEIDACAQVLAQGIHRNGRKGRNETIAVSSHGLGYRSAGPAALNRRHPTPEIQSGISEEPRRESWDRQKLPRRCGDTEAIR
jgi:hypothetical protein